MPLWPKIASSATPLWQYARPVLVVAAYLLPVGLIIHAVTFWGRGIIDAEAMDFVLNYLQKRPLLAQIFDPQINDWGAYQARELSYVFDLVDARVFATLLDRGIILFVPLSGVLGLVAFGGVFFVGARKVLGLSAPLTNLLLGLFLSCIVVQASTPILYRSSKIILSVALLGFLFYLVRLLTTPKAQVTWRGTSGLFILAVLMSLCDRQGFYYLISATAVVLMLFGFLQLHRPAPARDYLQVCVALGGAIAAVVFYNRVFAPQLIYSLNGYWPNFTYQNLSWSTLLDPLLLARAWLFFQQQVSFFFGNIPFAILAAVALVTLLATLWKRSRASNRRDFLIPLAIFLACLLAILGLLAAMIARHPAVYSVRDHSFWYYPLSLHVVFLFGLSVGWSYLCRGKLVRFSPALYAVILVLIILNVRLYGQQRETMIAANGWFQGQHEHSRALVEQFATAPPRRELLLAQTGDLFLNDQEHFLENVERAYLHLTGATTSNQKQP